MENMRTGEARRRLTFTLGALAAGLALLLPRLGWAQVPAQLENPRPGSFQSGIGVINGWVCEAEEVVIEINGTPVQAAYGTTRRDTQVPSGPCADDLTGFGLTVNWNLFGDGVQMVRALADGVEFGRAAVTVTTLGLGEFPQGLSRRVQVANFPQAGANTEVQWQESQQNFVIGSGTPSGGGNSGTAGIQALLEDPRPGSFQSGIGVIRGWVCEAEEVVIEINGTPIAAAYGTTRRDTQMPLGPCADDNTGFGLTFNWNLVGAGLHRVRALADGVEFANVTFTVTTLGLGEFPQGLSGSAQVGNFPQAGTGMRVQWQESQQNFPLAGALPPGVIDPASQCTTRQGMATDPAGGQAITTWTNPCLLLGNTMLAKIQSLGTGANTAFSDPALRGQSAGGFFLCGNSLAFSQENQMFGSSEFTVLDSAGNAICREIPPGREIDILVPINDGSFLNFNIPFGINYAGQSVVSFRPMSPPPCQVSVSPTQLDFGMVAVGSSRDLVLEVTNSGPDTLVGDLSVGLNPDFSIISGEMLNIASGQHQGVTVRFTPSEEGEMNGSVTINSNCGSALVALSGIGTATPQLEVSRPDIDFGDVNVDTSAQETFTITNVGGGTLMGDATLNCGECGFTILSGGSFSLGPGESQDVVVEFSPASDGLATDTVNVTSNGGDATVNVSGTGVIPPQLSVDPDMLNFGTILTTFADLPFTVTNTGGGTLTGSVTIAASSSGDVFSIVSGDTFSLGPGESQEVVIRFTPEELDLLYTGNAEVSSNGGSATVSLQGTGGQIG
jgi:hypothetical protein